MARTRCSDIHSKTAMPCFTTSIRSPLRLFRQRDAAAARRKDAHLKDVIITERWDKKAAKYGTATVPFPFDSVETYERSARQPLGRDFNTDASFRWVKLELFVFQPCMNIQACV